MPNPRQLLRDDTPTVEGAVVSGYVSTNQPLPASFDDPMYVVVAGHSTDLSIPCAWGAIHGATLPAPNAAVLVAFGDDGIGRVVWWDGQYSLPPLPLNATVVVSVTQSATPAIDTDLMSVAEITGIAQAITSMSSGLTGTPTRGQTLEIRLTDNGTGRAITWGAKFASSTVTLPTTTVATHMLLVRFVWDDVASLWRCVLVA